MAMERPAAGSMEKEKPVLPGEGERHVLPKDEQKAALTQKEVTNPVEPRKEMERPAVPIEGEKGVVSSEEEKPVSPKEATRRILPKEGKESLGTRKEEVKPIVRRAKRGRRIAQKGKEKQIAPKEGKKPAVPKEGEERPAEPTEGEERPVGPKEGEERPVVPDVDKEKPVVPEGDKEKPVVPEGDKDHPALPEQDEEKHATWEKEMIPGVGDKTEASVLDSIENAVQKVLENLLKDAAGELQPAEAEEARLLVADLKAVVDTAEQVRVEGEAFFRASVDLYEAVKNLRDSEEKLRPLTKGELVDVVRQFLATQIFVQDRASAFLRVFERLAELLAAEQMKAVFAMVEEGVSSSERVARVAGELVPMMKKDRERRYGDLVAVTSWFMLRMEHI
uniref:Putative tryptophan-rich antigen, related protein n=1 Tax=Toxoplasma gondii TgCATBr9 TaxID=943120 RepID=A0A2T6IS37_TOXGO|nr:putative tryptophan-rich antigen, related protein [Toxoplasma gondii TgCATBr9]